MKREHYLGMRAEDLVGKPYAQYWNPVMQPLQEQVSHAILHGPEASELGFGIDQADLLVEPGYLPLENGTTKLTCGEIFVAVLTKMPGVTGAMFEWWMGWHYMEHQRYKLWHPRAHVANGTKEMKGDDPALSDREKYLTTHYVTEYVGNTKQDITISFSDPAEYFSNTSAFAENGITATVCGTVGLQQAPITIGRLIHQIREVEGGSEMRSRFWLAKPEIKGVGRESLLGRLVSSDFVVKRIVDPDLGRDMVVHCGMEMNHLASFLPALYSDYHA
ncbi:MAG: hypothetical protein JRE71_18725 [Deltaproteobacteria bacterium]|nr:hypothetical protein [Deltaproteobacteria bacterium]